MGDGKQLVDDMINILECDGIPVKIYVGKNFGDVKKIR